MDRRDAGFEMIAADLFPFRRKFEMAESFGDKSFIPERTILILEPDQFAIGVNACSEP